uniref:DUF674 family protein n=1 Tax=Cajanus cajan TaxID=3821 RepID=A0A151QQ84_CAJCA|nr:hypothetical protein KK1_046865 [Cajanus cajan]
MYAEGGKDFVDVLLSYLTLPLGTIVRLVPKESNLISSLYESVSHLDKKHLWTPTCKEMLLQPRKSLVLFTHSFICSTLFVQVLDLLKFSLLSKTPLTDLITKKQFLYFNKKDQSQFEIGEVALNESRKMVVKVLVRKSYSKILFAEAKEDFTDFLLSFLTLPLGGVLHILKGFTSLSCLDKLYKSVAELCSERYLRSQGLKKQLVNPPCTPQFNLNDQIPVYYCNSYEKDKRQNRALVTFPKPILQNGEMNAPLDVVNPKSSDGKSSSCGFAKGAAMYMVTDDLVVTPISSISAVSYFNKSKVGILDLEHRVINIGLKEVKCFSETSLNFSYSTCTIAYIIYYRMKIIDSTMLHDPLCGRQDAHCRIPPTGHIKLNGDGVVSNDGIGACGGAVRDSSGRLLTTRK